MIALRADLFFVWNCVMRFVNYKDISCFVLFSLYFYVLGMFFWNVSRFCREAFRSRSLGKIVSLGNTIIIDIDRDNEETK